MKKSYHFVFFVFSLSMILLLSSCTPAATPVLPQPSPTNLPPTRTPQPTSTSQPTSTPIASPLPEEIIKDIPLTVAEAEKLAGFDVREPTYLPKGVFLEYATYETPGFPGVTLQYKLIHEKYGDVGHFFMISQVRKTEAPADATSCGKATEGCEILQIKDVPVVYNLYRSPSGEASTEGFAWYTDGFFFRLHRMAGEPNKIYKEELLKVVESMN